MNSITKIALSLSLTAFVAQSAPDMSSKPMTDKQTAPFKERAKKTAKIAAYLVMIGGGIFGLRYSHIKYNNVTSKLSIPSYWDQREEVLPFADLREAMRIIPRFHITARRGQSEFHDPNYEATKDMMSIAEKNQWEWARKCIDRYFVQFPEQFAEIKRSLGQKQRDANFKHGAYSLVSLAFIAGGLYGLKKELCPNFKPIEWIKNKVGIKPTA